MFCFNSSKVCKMLTLATRTLRSLEVSRFPKVNVVPGCLGLGVEDTCYFCTWGYLFLSLPWGHMWRHDSVLPLKHRKKLWLTLLGLDLGRYISLLPPSKLTTPSGLIFLFIPAYWKWVLTQQNPALKKHTHRKFTLYCRALNGGLMHIQWTRKPWFWEEQFCSLHETHLSIKRQWSNFGFRQEQGHWA